MKILVVSDSHGAGYSGFSYVSYLRENYNVDLLDYGGVPLNKVYENMGSLDNKSEYDLLIVQVGNPDVHPRLPKRFKFFLRKINRRFNKESTYALPANFCFKFLIKLPFFLLKRLVTTVHGAECYNSPQEIVSYIKKIESLFDGKVMIVGLFHIDKFFYGRVHNRNVDKVNSFLKEIYGESLINVSETSVKESLCADRFHFGEKAHVLLGEKIKIQINTENSLTSRF